MSRTLTVPNPQAAPGVAHSIALSESANVNPDGTVVHGVWLDGVVPTTPDTYYEAWVKITGDETDDWVHAGTTRSLPMLVQSPLFMKGGAYTVALVICSWLGRTVGPEGSTSATITLAGTGMLPSDVTGFSVTVENGQLLFSWTAVSSDLNPDVVGYEIRAGSTGWSSATVVGCFAPRCRPWALVPRSKAAGTSFYIKAQTRLGDYSSGVATATLSSASATCIDNDSTVGYQEVTIVGGARTVTVTTRCPYAAAPYLTATASVNGRSLALTTYTYAQNPDLTWTCTLRASANAPAAGSWTVHVHEAGA